MKKLEESVIDFIQKHPHSSSSEILNGVDEKVSLATIKRVLSKLVSSKDLELLGRGRGTKYRLSAYYKLFKDVALEEYYKDEIDERDIIEDFNFALLDEILPNIDIFSAEEIAYLDELQNNFTHNIAQLSPMEITQELERLAIDLSWKSSQIEGNTYSLLETERLLKEKQTASGKTQQEATMLLNHKDAIDFIIENPSFLHPISTAKIEDIHSILIKELQVQRNIRKRRVGISGTNYRPLDNAFQIEDALTKSCEIINQRNSVFEQAFLSLLLISYIQPFSDGNKRTARIVSNAILLNEKYCPISFRTVDSIDYKKAMLLFYEQNNITAMKKIFIAQYAFATKTYF